VSGQCLGGRQGHLDLGGMIDRAGERSQDPLDAHDFRASCGVATGGGYRSQ
jgi:hypothetical protein